LRQKKSKNIGTLCACFENEAAKQFPSRAILLRRYFLECKEMSYRILSTLTAVVSVASAGKAFSQTFRFESNPSGWLLGPGAGPSSLMNARCSENQMGTNEEAMARIDWADKCGFVSKEKWSPLYFNNIDPLTAARTPRAKYAYPLFVHDDSATAKTFPVWVPDYTTCEMPADVVLFTFCEAGCYALDQQIAFTQNGKPKLLKIKDAYDIFIAEIAQNEKPKESSLRLYGVTQGSTFEKLSFFPLALKRIIASARNEMNTLLTFKTAGGGELKVTPEHPLVSSSGHFRKAHMFKTGEELVKQDGTVDPITQITSEEVMGKVYNLEPRSSNPTENIHIAQGFLAGSLAVQNGDIRDLKRVLARSHFGSTELNIK
jgi:hypothetical protein